MIPYSIMHLNRRVASVRADGTCTVYYPSFMPYNLYLEQGDDIVMRRDPYGYHMMNIVDYLVGNTDRHWGNWGFWADNATNRLTKLYPLMDFNRAFGAYDTLEGVRCQTAPTPQSQMEAALCGVRQIGLNQIAPISDDWFDCADRRAMLHRRLCALQDDA